MGEPHDFYPAKLVIPTLVAPNVSVDELREALVAMFGAIDIESSTELFTFTSYYTQEMGAGLRRLFFAFETLVDPSTLAEIKIATNGLETRYRTAAGRTVNLDPGLLMLSRFILATTKDHSHRVPLRDGIFAEVTLLFRNGSFVPLEWTYPDYRSEWYARVLMEIRERLHRQLKERLPNR